MNLDINTLQAKIQAARTAYYNSTSIMSDDEYDLLVETLFETDPNNALLHEVGAEPSEEWKKEKHLFPLGSLNKTNSFEELSDWSAKYSKNNTDFVLVEKLDGLSAGAEYKNGKLVKSLLRGSGLVGENIRDNFIKMIGVKTDLSDNFTGVLRGEILLTDELHKQHFPEYSNPRNTASGICRRLDGVGCQYLSVYFYQVMSETTHFATEIEQFDFLNKNKLLTPNYYKCQTLKEAWQEYENYVQTKRNTLPYWIDGLVLSCNDLAHQKEMGILHLKPRAKIALKFPNQLAKTIIKDIEFQIGNSGRLTPVAYFDKINLLGSEVEKASLYNMAYIQKLNVGIGSTVLVCKAGEIIPRVETVLSEGKPIVPPTECPACEGKLEMIGENLQCVNVDGCPEQIIGRLKNWINTLDIMEWGDKLLERLVSEGLVEDITDLYRQEVEDLMCLERMGEKSATKCYNELWARNPIALDLFLGGLSIPLVGSSTIQMLMNNGLDSLDKIRDASYEDLLNIKGLGPGKAQSLFDGLQRNDYIIEELLEMGLKIQTENEQPQAASDHLKDKVICITGSTNTKRDDLIKIIKENGGQFVSSVNKSCTHLVLADPSKVSSKTKKATSLGVNIVSEEDFFSFLD